MEKSMGSSNEAKVSHFLGVDFGKSKIGLALADDETKMAFAFATLPNDGNFLAELKEIIAEKNVKKIIIGMTRHEKDEKSADDKIKFAELLKEQLQQEVVFQDEAFTTKMAQDNIKQRGGKNVAKLDDKEAARIILQSWLDKEIVQSLQTKTHVS